MLHEEGTAIICFSMGYILKKEIEIYAQFFERADVNTFSQEQILS